MPIATVFDPPLVTDSTAVFNTKAFDTAGKLNAFATEANALETNVNAKEGSAAAAAAAALLSATNAASAASLASLAADVTAWDAGLFWTVGDVVYSPTNYQAYRRKSPGGMDATDPAADTTRTYWEPLVVNGLYLVIVSGAAVTAVAGQLLALTNAAATTVTGPAVALAGDRFGVVVCNGLATNVVNWNSLKHMGGLTDATTTLDDTRAWIEPLYISAANGWSFKA